MTQDTNFDTTDTNFDREDQRPVVGCHPMGPLGGLIESLGG